MRRQYHLRPSEHGYAAWDVHGLIARVAGLPVEQVPLSALTDVDTDYWFRHGYAPTVRAVVEHLRLVQDADLAFPVVLDPDGGVMDGMHRIAKALLLGHATIGARRLPALPPPDHVDVQPYELSYD